MKNLFGQHTTLFVKLKENKIADVWGVIDTNFLDHLLFLLNSFYRMKKLTIFFIKIYQNYLSWMFLPSCRFYPTCSEYAILAIEKYGLLKGIILSIWRILRCNPLCKGGYDPP